MDNAVEVAILSLVGGVDAVVVRINPSVGQSIPVRIGLVGVGFSGIENQLFLLPNTRMLYGDAKASIQSVVSEFKSLAAS